MMRTLFLLLFGFGLLSAGSFAQENSGNDSDLWQEYTGKIQVRTTAQGNSLLYLQDKNRHGYGHFILVQNKRPVLKHDNIPNGTVKFNTDKGYYRLISDGGSKKLAVDDNIYGLSDFTASIELNAASFKNAEADLIKRPDFAEALSCQCQDVEKADTNCLSGGEGSVVCSHKNRIEQSKSYCRVIACGEAYYACCTPEKTK